MSLIAVAGLPFEVEADHFKLVNKGEVFYASGNVVIAYKQYSLKSNDLQYSRKNNELKLIGDVSIYDRQNNHLMADSLRLFLDSEEGEILNGHIKTNKDYIIQSNRIVLKSDVIELKECSITTCQSLSPEWYFKSQFLSVNQRNNFINADQNTLYFYGLPVFYIPSFSQSVSDATISKIGQPQSLGIIKLIRHFLMFILVIYYLKILRVRWVLEPLKDVGFDTERHIFIHHKRISP